MDLRLLLVGALLPDLIDTPVGLVFYDDFGGVRLFSHTILFASFVMLAVVVLTRRGRPRKRWMPLAIGILTHLVLDAMWADPESLWWPFLGTDFATSGFGSAGALVTATLSDWRVWALEAVGGAYIFYLAHRGRLAAPGELAKFLRTGRIAVPIEGR